MSACTTLRDGTDMAVSLAMLLVRRNSCKHIAPTAAPPALWLDLQGEFRRPLHLSTLRIGQRVDHGEMVGAWNFFIMGLRPGPRPRICHGAALTLEFARLQSADGGIEAASGSQGPEQRRDLACRRG